MTTIRMSRVCALLGDVSSMTVYRKMKSDPTFPKPTIIFGKNLWKQEDIEKWLESKMNGENDGNPSKDGDKQLNA